MLFHLERSTWRRDGVKGPKYVRQLERSRESPIRVLLMDSRLARVSFHRTYPTVRYN